MGTWLPTREFGVGGVALWLGRRSLAGRLSLTFAWSMVDRCALCG